jgi:hypothetical protein
LDGYTLIFVEQIAARRYGFTRIPVFLLAQEERGLADDARALTMATRGLVRHAGGESTRRRWILPGAAAGNRSG